MHPARRSAVTVLGVLAALALAGCSDAAPSVLVASGPAVRIPSPAPIAQAPDDDPAAMALAAPAAPPHEVRHTPGDGVLIDGLGLLRSEQHDVAFGTVVNPTGAAVRVTLDVITYDDGGAVLSTDNTTEVEVPAGDSTLFVADVITPEGTTVARMDAAHSVAVPLSAAGAAGAPAPSLTVQGRTIHPDRHNPTITGRVVSSYPEQLEAVRITAVCTADGKPVAAGYGLVPIVPARGSAAYEVTLYGVTPDACSMAATP